jgi:organic radical activating enzyme
MVNIIHPIKVERVEKNNYKIVEWRLGNTCNYDCSFCGDNIKNGSERWLDFEVYRSVCEQLMNISETENKKTIFQFTGGEPTLYPKLIELIEFIKSKNHHVNLISNGSRTIRWWQELADKNLIDYLFITAHAEQKCDIDHIIELVELFVSNPTFVGVQCTALPEYFDIALLHHKKVYEKACCSVSLKLINSTTDLKYTDDQLKSVSKNSWIPSKRHHVKKKPNTQYSSKMRVTFSDSTVEVDLAHSLIAKKITNFFGWKCSIGIDYLNISYDKVYRGQCRQGGIVQSIYDPIKFQDSYVTCFKNKCDCATDYHETKFLK